MIENIRGVFWKFVLFEKLKFRGWKFFFENNKFFMIFF